MQVIESFDRGADAFPDRACFVLADGSRSWSFREIQTLSHRIGAALARDGFGEGSKVAVLSPNDPVAFTALLGALRINATWVALNAKSTPQDNADLLETVECDVLVYHPKLAAAADLAEGQVASLRTCISLLPGGRDGDPVLDDWMEPEGTQVPLVPDRPEAVAMMLGTGGTTGRPKAVQITHRGIQQMNLAFLAHLPEQDPVQLVAAPMSHAAGGITFCVFAVGGTHIIHDGVVPKDIFESIERHKVTRLFLPPTAIYALLAHPDVRSHDFSSLRHFIYAAAPMSVDKLKESMEVFGPVMTQTFGQAEAPMICTVLTPRDHVEALESGREERLASCGRPSVVATVRIMDDDGTILGPGEKGEIVVRGDLVMPGYYKDPEQSEAVRRPGGWHGTGDIGQMDEDGFVSIVDRKRDMIISGGFNVFPSEVEQVIWGHPAVNDCAVIGLPDEKWGESVTAVVELKPGQEVEADELVKLCRDRLGPVKTPKTVIFRELPRSPVGKVLKRELRDEFWSGRARAV
ncbi:MAG TPA: AMP-binding protein [Baekduia sp.]|nr:AMP-binding protein [Baekduia sp.]